MRDGEILLRRVLASVVQAAAKELRPQIEALAKKKRASWGEPAALLIEAGAAWLADELTKGVPAARSGQRSLRHGSTRQARREA